MDGGLPGSEITEVGAQFMCVMVMEPRRLFHTPRMSTYQG